MVFCGRPSRACQQCRTRRLRCDLRRGTCSQCERARLACAGYRDVEQLRIRDQSQATISKAVRRASRRVPAAPASLLPSVQQQARDAFFSRYVVGNLRTYDYLQTFYSTHSMDEHLATSIDAVSLAYLSHQVSSPYVSNEARQKYVSALRLTNTALRSTELAVKDTTLLSTLLLDLFEKFMSDKPRSNGPWISHVNGALALVKMRGEEQFSNSIGLRMVVRLSTNILISFVACDSALPAEFSAIRSYAARFLDVEDPKWRLTDLMVLYATFRARLCSGRLSGHETIINALELDKKYFDLMQDMPLSWHYETIHLAAPADSVFQDHIHVYATQHVTQAWNVIRMIRIILNDTVRKSCLDLRDSLVDITSQEISVYLSAATDSIQVLASEICASAPQYFDALDIELVDTSTWQFSTNRISSSPNLQSDPSLNYLRCYTLLFPLYIAARYAPDTRVNDWVIRQLHNMSSKCNFKNAHLVAELLDKREDINPWLVYVMLGSYAFAA